MKPALLFLILFIAACCQGQILTSYAGLYNNNGQARMDSLFWIKTINDFDQKPLSEWEIENRIANIITNSNSSFSVECPLNSKKLSYLGFIAPKDLDTAFTSSFFKTDSTMKIKRHIYRYGIFYIAVPDKKSIDALNVFFTIRALNILKYKYPEAYAELVTKTLSPVYEAYLNALMKGQMKNIRFLNYNKFFFISFNNVPVGIASGITALNEQSYRWIKNSNVSLSGNFPYISIHNTKLLGADKTNGSGAIYGFAQPSANYEYYMRDGLVETLAHEFIHRYIDVFASVDTLYEFLYTNRYKNDTSLNALEESMTRYTAWHFFEKKRGVSTEMLQFEKVEADLTCVDLLNRKKLADFVKLITNLKGTNYGGLSDILRLPLWRDQDRP